MKRIGWKIVVLTTFIALSMAVPAMAQPGPGGGGPGGFQGGRGGQGGGQFNPAQMQQQMSASIKDALGATDDEWAVLGPKIQNIQTLQNAAGGGIAGSINNLQRMFARAMGGGGAGGRGGGMGNLNAMLGIKDSTMKLKMDELQAALDNKDTTDVMIKEKLDAVRQARDKARLDLDAARKDLIGLLTSRQEAILFGMGILE